VTGVVTRAGRREWVGLAVIALPCLLYSMDLTVLNLAVPQLSADLQPTSAQLLWIIDIYGFLAAGSLVTMGTSATGSAAAGCCWPARPRSGPPRCWPRSRPLPRC
jgi:hypothetical protein